MGLLLGSGNAVCGTSAIVSTSKVIKGNDHDTGLSIGAVNFMGTIGIFLLPFIVKILGFNELNSADLIGGTIQAVGQVVAAGYSIGDKVGSISVLIKMTRVLMLGPVIFILSMIYSRPHPSETQTSKFKLPVPLFIIGFFAMSLLAGFSVLPGEAVAVIKKASDILLAISMVGIGMKIEFRALRSSGPKIMMAEVLISAAQIGTAILLVTIISRYFG